MCGHNQVDQLLGDFCDGSDFKNHPLFYLDEKCLQLMLYYDDVEVCNPLGSKVKLHKLGMLFLHSFLFS